MKEGNDMNNFSAYMKSKIIETVNDSEDEDLIRYMYSMLMEFQIDKTREEKETLLEITGTC